MALNDSFRHQHVLKAQRPKKVRTPKGAKFFNAPIGTPITPELMSLAMERHGKAQAIKMMVHERDAKTPATPHRAGGQAEVVARERRAFELAQKRKNKGKRKAANQPPERAENQNRGGKGYPNSGR